MNLWIEAARPQTLIASISPVLLGTIIGLDAHQLPYYLNQYTSFPRQGFHPLIFLSSLLFALCIQIGTNFANDYIDFMKGADTLDRKGPRRLVQSGLISINKMRKATIGVFVVAGIIGAYLTIVGGWQVGILALCAIIFGYIYTGGPFPLGYLGLGDLFVLIFFGPVAVASVSFLQTGLISKVAIFAGFGPGLISTALIAMNNVRDISGDTHVNKKTLPVRFGKKFGIWEIIICLIGSCLVPIFLGVFLKNYFFSLISITNFIFVFPIIRSILKEDKLSPLFPRIGKMFIFYTLLFTLSWGSSWYLQVLVCASL